MGHTAEILKLLQTHGCMNFKDSDYRSFRRLLVGMVLSTDLASGYKNLANVKEAFPGVFTDRVKPPGPDRRESVSRKSSRIRNSGTSATLPSMVSEIEIEPPSIDVTQDLLNLVVECADVSHPARGLEIHKRWSILITHEFLQQGELEEARGIPISPLCARGAIMDNPSFARAQQGFLDFVVSPKLRVISKLCGQDMVWLRLLAANRSFWGAHDSPGFTAIANQLD